MWLLALLPLSLAASIPQGVSVGQLLNVTLTPRTKVTVPMEAGLPEWMYFSNGQLLGIPTIKDVGRVTLQLQSPGNAERTLTLRIPEDDTNPCGEKESTWLEVVYPQDADVQERVQEAKKVADTLGVGIETLRMVDFDYSRQFRRVENIGGDGKGAFVVIKPYCDGDAEAMDLATDDMDKLLEDDDDESAYEVTITKGKVLSRRQRGQGEDVLSGMDFHTNEPETVTRPSTRTTTQRSTRQSPDNPPVRLNSLSGISCTAGNLCESLVPETTFKDAEEGDSYKLQLTVTLLDDGENFLFYKDHKIQGVPLKAGEYQFRLDARDRRGQMASAPFSVSIKPALPHNHVVTFQMDLAKTQDMQTSPELLVDFVRKLSQVTKSKTDAIAIRDISRDGDKALLSWSNNSIPYKTCSEKSIEAMTAPMYTKRRNIMSRQFETAMTSRFNLRKVEHALIGNCAKEEDLGTTVPTVEATSQDTFPWLVLLGALLVVVLIGCIVMKCMKKKSKKGTKPSEYVGKGLPVVFPEEVPDDYELANAGTPMLTKEERPPLKISSTHENPLYRPPPPLASASPRVGSATGSLPPTQRMPPPYLPP